MAALGGRDMKSVAAENGQPYPPFTKWCNGKALPSKTKRQWLSSKFGVPIEAWDIPIDSPAPPAPSSIPEEEPAPITQRYGTAAKSPRGPEVVSPPSSLPVPGADAYGADDVPESGPVFQFGDRPAKRELEAQIERLKGMIDGRDLTHSQKIAAINSMGRLTRQLAELSGELKPTEIRRLMSTMEFREVFSTIARVLKRRCPGAIPEIVEALGLLDTEKQQRSQKADKAA